MLIPIRFVNMNSKSMRSFISKISTIGQVSCILPLCLLLTSWSYAQQSLSELHTSFANPPADSKIMMRWWWFGPAVTKQELQRELEQMKAAGIGGLEVATLYPQALDDPATGFHNVPFLSDEYIDNL